MKLYLKQHVFTWGDRFTIKDGAGADRYYVEGEVFTFGKKLHIYDLSGREVAYIEQQLLTWLPRYTIYIGGSQAAQVVKELSLWRPHYRIEGPDWEVEGDFFAHEYEFFQGGHSIAAISKHWMTWGDSYELDISNSADEVLVLSTVLAIDAVLESQND